MSAPRTQIPSDALRKQADASRPDHSVFVAANAGSGKTYVLVNRVIRLLLKNVEPEKILCITFTKAAAANMAHRIFEKLGRWVTLTDDELNLEIQRTGEAKPNDRTRSIARSLFANTLETPGGLKVQTIHALCTRLLQQFPFEANVPAHFSVLDDRDRDDMMSRAQIAVLAEAGRAPEGELARALSTAMTEAADTTFQDVIREACLANRHFLGWMDGAGDAASAIAQAAAALGVSVDERIADIDALILNGPDFPMSKWLAAAAILATGSKTDAAQAERLRRAYTESGVEKFEAYVGFFMTNAGTPRSSIMTKPLAKTNSDLEVQLDREQQRIAKMLERRLAVAQRDRAAALIVIAHAVGSHYRSEKQSRGALDYDDLIQKTLALLQNVSASWVHYKLDLGIDQVLIDEAQDTSPQQWDIVQHLTAEFTTGEGARAGIKRTVFAVGDEKQSIFSFQGAAPREFDARLKEFDRKHRDANLAFNKVKLNHSFRSGRAILNAVDCVFREEAIYKSIQADESAYPIHEALDDARPALIDLWPLEKPRSSDDGVGWDAPLDATPEESPEAILARRVRDEIAHLISARTQTGNRNTPRRLQYRDILILVRRRGIVFDAVIQALKQAQIPVAGADRLKLTEHIAVIDLMNLADALLLPHDDLALATALKSPLFGLDDDDLLAFAPTREGSLRDAFAAHASTDSKLAPAFKRLQDCEARIGSMTPFAFFAWLLGGDGGRVRMLSRLGHEANDALDEFLEMALSYEQRAVASMQGFVAWLRAAETEVKRDMEMQRDEVRVMTVHGAKGLEASVVFLIDTVLSTSGGHRKNLVSLPQGNASPYAPNIVLWTGSKANDVPVVADARQRMLNEDRDEYRRLLYVAMTRAADRLIVGGCEPGTKIAQGSWYELIQKGLIASGMTEESVKFPHVETKRYTLADENSIEDAAIAEHDEHEVRDLPVWLREQAPRDPLGDVQIRPSDPVAHEAHSVLTAESFAARAKAMRRGTLVHRLLQFLPDVVADKRRQMTDAYLAREASAWTTEEREALSRKIVDVIEADDFKPLFATGSRAEVSVVGRIARHGKSDAFISGQIDRLVITETEVWIVDFKTNYAPPKAIGDVPHDYVRQLALYRGVLSKLYAGRKVRCALLWTETAQMMEIPPSMLDAELRSATS